VLLRAYCPNNTSLMPNGTITATVQGEGVWLKKADGTYEKSLQVTLTPGQYGGQAAMIAQFTVAADRPGQLPHDPVTAGFTATLGPGGSPVSATTTVEALVPQTMVNPDPNGDTVAVRGGEEFAGHLVWYADEVHGDGLTGEKYYWGATGKVTRNLPRGTIERPYRLNTDPPEVPYQYSSATTTDPGPGSRSISEEHDFVVTSDVNVTPNPKQWAEEHQAEIGAPYNFFMWVYDTAKFLLKKWF